MVIQVFHRYKPNCGKKNPISQFEKSSKKFFDADLDADEFQNLIRSFLTIDT